MRKDVEALYNAAFSDFSTRRELLRRVIPKIQQEARELRSIRLSLTGKVKVRKIWAEDMDALERDLRWIACYAKKRCHAE